MLHREHCDILQESEANYLFFWKSLDYMLDLSLNFRQNLMHVFLAACKPVFNFLFAFEYQTLHTYSRLDHCVVY